MTTGRHNFSVGLLGLCIILLTALSAISQTSPTIRFIGWIPVQTLSGGKPTEFDLTRFLALEAGDKLELERTSPLEGVSVDLDPVKLILRISPAEKSQGMEDLLLKIRPTQREPLEGIFTFSVQNVPATKFKYFGTGSEKSVSVAGSFNGWNTGANPLKKTGENTWELSVALPPGSHTYKLVVDGQWRLDPTNKQKAGDGTGNENSLVQVSGASGSAPVLFARSRSAEVLLFGCHPENWKPAKFPPWPNCRAGFREFFRQSLPSMEVGR